MIYVKKVDSGVRSISVGRRGAGWQLFLHYGKCKYLIILSLSKIKIKKKKTTKNPTNYLRQVSKFILK